MAGKARIQVFGLQAEGHNGPAQTWAGDSVMSNEPNCPHFWAKNAGRPGNEANSPGLRGGEGMR